MELTAPKLGRVRALDGLRGIAVLIVVAAHSAGNKFPGGALGVDLFFVLSGFLITQILLEERSGAGRIRLRRFYARRMIRLGPALLVVLAFAVVAPRILANIGTVRELVHWHDIVGSLLYVQNFVYMVNFKSDMIMRHAWSLAVEEQFYLLWPMALMVPFARRASAKWLLAGAAVAMAQTIARYATGTPRQYLYAGTISHGAIMLLTGGAISFWFCSEHWASSRRLNLLWVPSAIVMAALVLNVGQKQPFYYLGGYVVVAIACGALLVASLNDAPALRRALVWRPLRWFGLISYSLYLWHMPIQLLGEHILKPSGHSEAFVSAFTVPLALCAATASYYLVEKPIRRVGRRHLQAIPAGAPAEP